MAESLRVPNDTSPGAERQDIVRTAGDAALGTRAHVRQSLERLRLLLVDARARRVYRGTKFTLGEALAATAVARWQTPPLADAELRESIRAYAGRLRADGVPVERMLVAVKSAVREAIPPDLDAVGAPAVMGDLVRESIAAFYEASPPT